MSCSKAIAVAVAGIGLTVACTQQVAVAPRTACDFTPMLTVAAPAEAVLVAPIPGTMNPMPLNTVSITDAGITNKVLVQAVGARRTETGTVEVWSRLVNCTDFPLQVEGRTQFMNKAQAPVEAPSAWLRIYLPPRATGVYSERSTQTQSAELYLIEIREGT